MSAEERVLAGKRIGVFGKGGSGKSTVVVLLARALRDRGYDVCVLDADSTNVGLHHALGLERAPASVLDLFGGMVFSGGPVTCPVDDPTPIPNADLTLDQLSGNHYARPEEGVLFLTAGKIGDLGPGAGCDGPVAKIARDLKVHLNGDRPLTLIDFKAGFEDSARGAVTSLDWIIVIVDPTTAAIQMATHMRDMVDQLRRGGLPATMHLESRALVELANRLFRQATVKDVLVMLNRVKDEGMEQYLRSKLAEKGIEPIGVIHEDPSIPMSWLEGRPVQVTAELANDIDCVVNALEEAAALQAK